MKYLKYFETEAGYASYKNGSDYVTPNVSFVENSDVVMFNPYIAPASPNLVCTYNVTDISQETKILHHYGLSYMTNMIVDGVEMEAETYYQFDTVGNHIVEFVLDDPTTMGDSTFSHCSELTSVIIPNSVTAIPYYAFSYCERLTEVTIGTGVTTIDNYAFDGCTGLTSINIPDSVTIIGNSAFNNCTGLTSINIPDSVTEIGIRSFDNCSGLTSATIGTGVTTIDNYAFNNCTGLTKVTIGSGVTEIGGGVFYGCSSLSEIACNAITAPTISNSTGGNTFWNVKTDGVLKVPAGSDYSSWMSTTLGDDNWTIEYI